MKKSNILHRDFPQTLFKGIVWLLIDSNHHTVAKGRLRLISPDSKLVLLLSNGFDKSLFWKKKIGFFQFYWILKSLRIRKKSAGFLDFLVSHLYIFELLNKYIPVKISDKEIYEILWYTAETYS